MNAIDIGILVVLLGSTAVGFRQGFILEIAALFGALVALGIARLEYKPVRAFLAHYAPHSPWLTIVSYLIVFLVVLALISLIARRVRTVIRLLMLGSLDRLGGAVMGFLQGALVVALLLYLARRVPNGTVRHAVRHSVLTPAFQQVIPYIHALFPHIPVQ